MAAAAAIGPLMQGYGNYVSGQAQADALEYQATIAGQNATLARQAGASDAARAALFANQKIGAEVAGYAASGVETNSGSAMAVIQSSHANAELDRLNILHGADIKAINFENQASIDRIGAAKTRYASGFGVAGGLIGAGANAYGQSSAAGPRGSQQSQDEAEFASVGGS